MKKLLLLLITLTILTNVSYASFPVMEKDQIEVIETIEAPAYDDSKSIWGILSLSFGIIGFFTLFSPIVSIAFSLLAIIFGIIGLTNKVNWMEIVGLILGVLMTILVLAFIGVLILSGGMH